MAPSEFACSFGYDRSAFLTEFASQFSDSPRYTAGAAQNSLTLLAMIERDKGITDIRWAAYILATTAWETTSLQSVTTVALNKKGKPLHDKNGKPIMVKKRRWLMTMAPVAEVGQGAGRRYHEPVKVKLLPDGSVRITEHDGDQFKVGSNGNITNLTKHAKLGAKDGAPASIVYDKDDGTEQVFYGRGYVQLTWWSNYAKAGVAIGQGFKLLVDPERVKDPEIAYKLMSYGMKTGKIFANGHKFADYFTQSGADYEGARAMVNGSDHAGDIAKLAKKFEIALQKSKCAPLQPNLRMP